MRRRDLLALAGSATTLPSRLGAQPTERVRRISYLTPATGSPEDVLGVLETRALVEGLREFGWHDGRNIEIDQRFSGSGRERIRANAKELIALNPDVIVTVGGPSLAAVLAETRTIPVVFAVVSDPVVSGFVSNLAHPDANVTGFAVSEVAIAGKWLQLLKEIAPRVSRALVIIEAESQPQQVMRDAVAVAATALGMSLATAGVHEIADVERAIEAFAREPDGALVIFSNAILANNQQRYHALAAQYRLPAVYSYPVYAQSGGLLSYGSDPVAQMREATGYIDKILRGAKPGDLPVQQASRFVLVVNLKTAQALGLTVPPAILARADEVIE
jgi:putative ABC transport system substrate-binding protein